MTRVVLGGGCFWCMEAVFQRLRGVLSVQSGYAGGHTANPDYHAVCAGNTGHAEVIAVEFDPEVITLAQLLNVFFSTHDPTTLNRQGHDTGTQYRSVILYHSEAQQQTAAAAIQQLSQAQVFANPIVTELKPLGTFYPAEAAHQDYYNQHRLQGYCQQVISPKLSQLRRKWQPLLLPEQI